MDNITPVVEVILQVASIGIAVIALLVSINTRKAANREGTPNFRIVQNLWTQEPYFELINEANSKLDEPLNPTYIMLIPSKVYFCMGDHQRFSLMVFSPISYEVITEQVVSGITKNQIVTSKLPACFFGKKGERDVIRKDLTKGESGFPGYVETYPFLVIVSAIQYKYNEKIQTDIVLSTSVKNCTLEEKDFINLCRYVKDNSNHEVKVPNDGSSIYQKANEQVCYAVKNMGQYPLFFGGDETDGYGSVLKKINEIITPHDFLGENFNKNDN